MDLKELKLTKNMIQGGILGIVILCFLMLKLFALGSVSVDTRFLTLFLGEGAYPPIIESGVVIDNYNGFFAYICNLFSPSGGVGGFAVYLGLLMQVASIVLLTFSAKALVGGIGGTASVLGFCGIFLQTDPLVSFITFFAAIQISIFIRFYTHYFTEEATIKTTILFSVIFGVVCSAHSSLSTYGLYLSFMLIFAGVIIVQKYQLIQIGTSLATFFLVNFIWKGYSLFNYRDTFMTAYQDLSIAIKSESFGTIMGNVLFISVVAVVCFGVGSQKLVFAIFILSISQLLYAVLNNFDAQGTLSMYLFIVLTAANAIELLYQTVFKEEEEIQIKRVDAHTILKDVEYIDAQEMALLKDPSKLSTSKMAMMESALDMFGSTSTAAEKKNTTVIDSAMMQDDIIDSFAAKDFDVEVNVEQEISMGYVPSVRDILGDLAASNGHSGAQSGFTDDYDGDFSGDYDSEYQEEKKEVYNKELKEEREEVFEEVEMLENPLPVPKKHVPTEMDFAVDLTDLNGDFDLINYGDNLKYDV